jgi:metal-dependent amidase/aminoacylase/carboxypeptidase family protein
MAEALASIRHHLPGAIKFIFQPAEETIQGAKAMIQAGVLENPKPEAIFALHTAPFPVGMMACPTSLALPGFDVAVIRLKGAGDLKTVANSLAHAILSLNTVPAGGLASLVKNDTPIVLHDFTYPQVDFSGQRGEEWVIEASVRASSETNYTKAKRVISEAVRTAKTDSVQIEMDYVDRQLADAINDTRLVQAAMVALRRVLGEQRVVSLDGAVPYFGEDFAFFKKQVPGVLLWLGVSNPERGIVGIPHLANYQADDGAILVGALGMACVLTDYLEQHSGAAQTSGRGNLRSVQF